MNKGIKTLIAALALVIVLMTIAIPVLASAGNDDQTAQTEAVVSEEEAAISTVEDNSLKSSKAIAAAIVVGIAAVAGAFGMAIAIGKAVDGTARQPEASGKIQTMLMLGLVFIETAIIYALIVAILIIFVL